MKVLIANIGNSDFKLRDQEVEDHRKEAREILNCAEDRELLEQYSAEIELPLLEALLDECGTPVDLLVAFVTDQHPSVGEKFFKKDTIYTGKLIKLLYENNIGRFANKVKKVELKVIRQAPVDLDGLLKLYPTLLESIEENISRCDEIYVSITGGTQTSVLSLLYSTLNSPILPGFKRYLYLNESTGKVQHLQTQTMLGRLEIINVIQRMLKQWDYNGISRLLDSLFTTNKHLVNIVDALKMRRNFCFSRIDTCLRKSLSVIEGSQRDMFLCLQQEAIELEEAAKTFLSENPSNPGMLINELFWNMAIKYEIGDYVDFLGRLYRFNEALMQYEICRINACAFTNIHSNNPLHFPDKEPTRSQMFHYLTNSNTNADKALVAWLKRLKASELIELRHNTIIAHSMNGAIEQEIKKAWNGDIIADTREMLEKYLCREIQNPFSKYNNWLSKYIHEVL